jgi:hypothetical protein
MSEVSLQSGAGGARTTPSWLKYCLLLSEVGTTWKGFECLGGRQMAAALPRAAIHRTAVSCFLAWSADRRDMPRPLFRSWGGGGRFLLSEVPL